MGVIMHKGIAYGGGSNVEANPAGSASDDISKVGINSTVYDIVDADAVHSADVGVADGVAGLDSNGKVPTGQLPTYPTVNNGTLTIQKNGSTVATFTANQSGNSNANISVPTQPSDINAADESDIESTKSTSGNPITITDAAPINAESLVVELEPKQDLNGYDYPWVGGAGYNKWDEEWELGALNTSTGELTSSTTYFRSKNPISVEPQTTYRFIMSAVFGYCFYDIDGNFISGSSSGTLSQNITSPANAKILRFFCKGTTYGNNISINYPATVTTYSPYSNICPISGYDSVSVDDVGKNLLNMVDVLPDGSYNGNIFTCSSLNNRPTVVLFDSPHTITFSYAKGEFTGSSARLEFLNGSSVLTSKGMESATPTSQTVQNVTSIRFNYGSGGTLTITEPQIELGETATTFEPYATSNATIQFGQTVYGGTVDFKTGVVTITDANIASYAGETLPSTWISDRDAYSSGGTPTTGAQVVYKLATPTTLQLTPAELKLLQNTNNISTNGTTINLGYQPNNVVGELRGEIEQAFYNHAMIYNIQSESTAVNMEYTDDYKAVVCEVPFVQEQRDYSTTPPTSWNINLSACDIAVNGFACFYEAGEMFIENYKVMPTIESVRKDDGCFKVGIGFYNVKMTSAADNIDNFIISMDITAFGKVLDSRTL